MAGIPRKLAMPNQVGFAVTSVDATLAHYRDRFGLSGVVQHAELDERCGYRYRGRPSRCRLKIGVIALDGVDLEFIEVLEGDHPARDHLQVYGEGVNHLGFFVDDVAAILRDIPPSFGEVAIEGTFKTDTGVSGRFVYLENIAGGPMYEVMALDS